MILIITNKNDYTADYVILKLKELGIEFFRFNTEDFPEKVILNIKLNVNDVDGEIKSVNQTVGIKDIKSVWYRRPKPAEISYAEDIEVLQYISAECNATLSGLWELLNCKWISHPFKIQIAESKLYQLKVASNIGFKIPETLVSNSPYEARSFFDQFDCLAFKTQKQPFIKQSGKKKYIFTNKVTSDQLDSFVNIKHSPVLLQPYINKKSELRVTVIGDDVFAVELHSQENFEAEIDWRKVEIKDLKHSIYELPDEVKYMCLMLVKTLGLSFGAIDFIITQNNELIFLEINPNGQWAWIEEVCPQIKLRESIINNLCNLGIS